MADDEYQRKLRQSEELQRKLEEDTQIKTKQSHDVLQTQKTSDHHDPITHSYTTHADIMRDMKAQQDELQRNLDSAKRLRDLDYRKSELERDIARSDTRIRSLRNSISLQDKVNQLALLVGILVSVLVTVFCFRSRGS